jgi:lipopolysaccharide transport system permease protein
MNESGVIQARHFIAAKRQWRLAIADVRDGVKSWEIWLLLGATDIRQRFKRSKFGQFWITLSTAIFIASLGVIYSFLFNQKIYEYIPYLSVNMVVWTLISGVITDSSTAFTQASLYLRQDPLPKTVFVIRLLVRNLITFAHNLVIVPVVFVLFGVVPSWKIILFIPGLALLLVTLFALTLISGLLCTRYRDLPQIVQSLLQIAFFVTPVMWRSEQMPHSMQVVVGANPLAALLRIVSDPILGQIPPLTAYAVAFGSTAVLLALALALFARLRGRIVYWL